MATPSRSFDLFFSNIVVLGLTLIVHSSVAEVVSPNKIYGLETRRGLVEMAGNSVVDVTSFGAKANDPMFDNAQAFMQAWISACHKGPGPIKVVIPPGNYIVGQLVFQGPCIANPITVEVQGTMKAVTDLSTYPNGAWFTIENVNGVLLKGGIFDGQGQSVWHYNDCKSNPKCQHMAASININKAQNIVLDGVTSLNSMGFHMSFTFSSNITATNVNITAPDESPNTDGIHISMTTNVNIMNSHIGTGDDCVGIIQGASNISIRNVQCGPGHGISIGSLGRRPNEKDVTGVHVSNCTLVGTTNGVRIKTYAGNLRLNVSNIVFEDIIMDKAKNPIIIDQNYGSRKNLKASSVKLSNVHFKNIRGTSTSPLTVSLACSKLIPCEVELADINLTYNGLNAASISASCNNTKPIYKGRQNPPPCPLA